MSFLEPENDESRLSKYVVQAGWKDIPHLDEDEKRKLVANTPLYQVKARTEGEPTLGAGAVYPMGESEIVVPDLAIPEHWPRAYAWVWVGTGRRWCGVRAIPRARWCICYSEHYQGQAEPASHAQAIRARGDWIIGVIDPACLGSSLIDGRLWRFTGSSGCISGRRRMRWGRGSTYWFRAA